jgi:hypothetical protein
MIARFSGTGSLSNKARAKASVTNAEISLASESDPIIGSSPDTARLKRGFGRRFCLVRAGPRPSPMSEAARSSLPKSIESRQPLEREVDKPVLKQLQLPLRRLLAARPPLKRCLD